MGKLSADKSRNSDKKNSTSDENARKRHQHGSANEYPTHPYPSYPYKKSSRKTTWNSEVWRARRPEELKGASPHTAVIYYLLFSVWLMLIAALIYAHCSVPSYFLPVPAKETKPVDELLSIMDFVFSTDEECMYSEKYDSPMSLSRGAMESLFCTLNERKDFNFNYLSFGMKRGEIYSKLLFNQSESQFNSIPATRLECEQKCDTYDEWITEDETYRQSITFDALKEKFDAIQRQLKPPKNSTNLDEETFSQIHALVGEYNACYAKFKKDATEVRLQKLFACFIKAQIKVQSGKGRSMAPVESGVTKCVVGGSVAYSGNRITTRSSIDVVVVCASTNRSAFRGVPVLTPVHNSNVPFISVIVPDGARIVDTVAMETFLERLSTKSASSIREKGLPYVIKEHNGTFEGYIDDAHPLGYDKEFWTKLYPIVETENNELSKNLTFTRISRNRKSKIKKLFKRSFIKLTSNMNGYKKITFKVEKRGSYKDAARPGKKPGN